MAMFGRNGKESSLPETRINTVIGEGTLFTGTLRVEGSIIVHGEFEGTLTASESVIVGKSGSVRAGISARDATVAGKIKGKIVAKDRVELQTGARLEGDVFAKSFMIEEGVYFQGNCSMGDDLAHDDGGALAKVPAGDAGLVGQR